MVINVYRNRSVVETFPVDDGVKLVQEFLGSNRIEAEVTINRILDLAIGDYIVYNAIKYYVNTLPSVVKNASTNYNHSIVFEAEYYDLAKVQFLNADYESDFNYMATAEDILDLIVTNMNRIYGTGVWTKGSCSHTNTDTKNLHFQGENCREVLQVICDEFDCEVQFSRKEIVLTDEIGFATGLTFQYKAGLRGITRKTESDKNIVTRLYARGSDRNIKSDYGSPRLQPSVTKNHVSNPGFETGDLTDWTVWGSPATRSVDVFSSPLVMPDGSPVPVGTYALHHIAAGGNDGSQQTITVKANTTYTLSAYVYHCEHPSYPNPTIRIMAYADSIYETAYTVNRNHWERCTVTFTTGAAQTSLTIYLGGIGEAYFDAVQLERRDVMTPYVDGEVTYLEKNVEDYGTIEHTVFWDEVFPSRTGTVSSVDGSHPEIFYDSSMDFDLNSYLVSGVTAKVNFLTGLLAGYTFEIEEYIHGTKKFTIIPYEQQNGVSLPEATLKPAASDTFTLLDITLPTSYVTAAEEDLLGRAETYIDENASPRVTYGLKPDPRYFKTNGISLNIGDAITVQDDDLDTDILVRVVKLEKKLHAPWECQIELSDTFETNIVQKLYSRATKLTNKAQIDGAGDITFAQLNKIATQSLKNIIVAPNGYIRIGLLTADNITTGTLDASKVTVANLAAGSITSGVLAVAYTEAKCTNALADQTSANTAAGIAGQGALATKNQATWTSDIASVPVRLTAGDTPAATGVYITPNYIGFYETSGGTWPIRIKNNAGSGELYVGNGSDKFISYASGVLTVQSLLRTAASGKRVVLDNSNNRLEFYNAGGTKIIQLDDTYGGGSQPGIQVGDSTNGGLVYVTRGSYGTYMRALSAPFLEIDEANATGPLMKITNGYTATLTDWNHIEVYSGASCKFLVRGDGLVDCSGGYRVLGTDVVGTQKTAVADAVNCSTMTTTPADVSDCAARTDVDGLVGEINSAIGVLNTIISRMESHGLIAT